jgi:hypothetical protein
LDLEGGVHLIWDLWRSGLQECKDNDLLGSQAGQAKVFGRVQKIFISSWGKCPCHIYLPERLVGDRILSSYRWSNLYR